MSEAGRDISGDSLRCSGFRLLCSKHNTLQRAARTPAQGLLAVAGVHQPAEATGPGELWIPTPGARRMLISSTTLHLDWGMMKRGLEPQTCQGVIWYKCAAAPISWKGVSCTFCSEGELIVCARAVAAAQLMGGNLLNHSNVSTLSHETIPKVLADSGPENPLPSHSVAPSSRGQGEGLKTCAV